MNSLCNYGEYEKLSIFFGWEGFFSYMVWFFCYLWVVDDGVV